MAEASSGAEIWPRNLKQSRSWLRFVVRKEDTRYGYRDVRLSRNAAVHYRSKPNSAGPVGG